MSDSLHIYYLEVVTNEIEKLASVYSAALGVEFSEPVPQLGGAVTIELSENKLLGIRSPMHESEAPTNRPYYLVDDIEEAVTQAQSTGAEIMLPPMDIPEYGKCAIINVGSIQSGFWQL